MDSCISVRRKELKFQKIIQKESLMRKVMGMVMWKKMQKVQ